MPLGQRAVILAGLAAATPVPAPAVAAAVQKRFLRSVAPCTGWGRLLPTAVRSGPPTARRSRRIPLVAFLR